MVNGGVASLAGGRPVLSWVDDGSLSPPPPNVPAAPSCSPWESSDSVPPDAALTTRSRSWLPSSQASRSWIDTRLL